MRKSRSIPEGGAIFPAAIFLAGKWPNLGRDSISWQIRAAGKSAKNFPTALKFAGKVFQHGLLEFSENWWGEGMENRKKSTKKWL